MSKATNGSKVKVHYTGRLEDGTVFDSSANREPLEFTVGGGQMIKGFDVAVNGMTIGDKKSVNIPSAEAYGEARADMILDVPREQVPADITPEVGMQLSLSQPDGQQVPVVITHVDDAKITLDANHPLAGKDLIFDIELVSVD
ncbi:FKBP-type peptidyl-prolyl cis-trans isomerase [Penaeicola halotolerans]|uniref:FKBP-type peptidyl-prolyl cis-trans isomerase n=1 Tax=Penaeicola halotolerans TaxID=2793196 RepID=UPI001CF816C3|nr:peptidylprolyl isomerase [Penaeicola halotolerans]